MRGSTARAGQAIGSATRAAGLADQTTIAVALFCEFSQPLSRVCEFLLGGSHAHVSWRLYDNGRIVCCVSLTACIRFRRLLSASVCCNVRASMQHFYWLSSMALKSVQICRACVLRPFGHVREVSARRKFRVSIPMTGVSGMTHTLADSSLQREPVFALTGLVSPMFNGSATVPSVAASILRPRACA